MGRCRVVQPEVVRLELSDGDWIDVKKRLTYGERTQATASVIGEMRADGWVRPNLDQAGLSQVVAYLVDWSLVDGRGKQIPIETDAQKLAALTSFDEATVEELQAAVEAHAKAMDAEVAAAKKMKTAGSPASAETSPSAG